MTTGQNQQTVDLEALRTRQTTAIRAFVNIYSPKVFNLCISYVQNKEEAEELVQDTLMAALDGLDKFKGQSKMDTWLYRIAVNKSLDYLKYKKRKKRSGFIVSIFGQKDEPSFEPIDFQHPGIRLESKEQMHALWAAINNLPERQKTALILAKIENRPQKEVAAIMEIQLKAVESLLQRAKTNLRKQLSDLYDKYYSK